MGLLADNGSENGNECDILAANLSGQIQPSRVGATPPLCGSLVSGSFGVGAGSNPAGLGTELGGAVVGVRADSPPRCSGHDTDLPFDQRGSVPSARVVVGPFSETPDPKVSPMFGIVLCPGWSKTSFNLRWSKYENFGIHG